MQFKSRFAAPALNYLKIYVENIEIFLKTTNKICIGWNFPKFFIKTFKLQKKTQKFQQKISKFSTNHFQIFPSKKPQFFNTVVLVFTKKKQQISFKNKS